jgi:hypothetical protein
MTDLAAIDLEEIKARQHDISANSSQLRGDKNALIAAVEALRERVAELEGDMFVARVHAAEAHATELAGVLDNIARVSSSFPSRQAARAVLKAHGPVKQESAP